MSTTKVYIEDVASYVDQEVLLEGWLYNKSSKGKLHFLQVRDGSGIIQCVMFKGDFDEATFELADHISQESSIRVKGKVRKDPRSPIGFELAVTGLELISAAEPYPITPKEHGIAFLMDQRHLWLRSKRQNAILKIRASIIRAVRNYFDSHGFTLVDAPIFTPSACEGTSTLFETQYHDQKAYLTQSGQLYMEAAAMAMGRAYCFGPTFRAEKSKTRRHLSEFWMVEPEVAFMDLNGTMDLAEDFLVSIVSRVLEECREHLEILERDITKLEKIQKPFPRILYSEAVEMLHKEGVEMEWGIDLGAEHETVLSNLYDRPVMVHRYPAQVKAFYMKKDNADPSLALCVDVLAPEGYGEIIGGGQREEDLTVLENAIRHHGLPMDAFEWYLDLRRYGSVPHSGFGLGIERTVAWLCGIHHVRETIPFPRTIDRIRP